MSKTNYVLAFYEIDRQYGGSEEGGWWYETGNLVRVARIVKSQDRAYAMCRRANDWLRRLNQLGRRRPGGYKSDINSVCYTGGAYACRMFEDTAPTHYPTQRPYYE